MHYRTTPRLHANRKNTNSKPLRTQNAKSMKQNYEFPRFANLLDIKIQNRKNYLLKWEEELPIA